MLDIYILFVKQNNPYFRVLPREIEIGLAIWGYDCEYLQFLSNFRGFWTEIKTRDIWWISRAVDTLLQNSGQNLPFINHRKENWEVQLALVLPQQYYSHISSTTPV